MGAFLYLLIFVFCICDILYLCISSTYCSRALQFAGRRSIHQSLPVTRLLPQALVLLCKTSNGDEDDDEDYVDDNDDHLQYEDGQ